MTFKYACRDLKQLFVNNKAVAILILLCVFTSSIIILSTYGIYQNYHRVIQQGESEVKEIDIFFSNTVNDHVTVRNMLECATSFSKDLYSSIDFCTLEHDEAMFKSAYDNSVDATNNKRIEKLIDFYFSFDDNGRLIDSITIRRNMMKNKFLEGDWFSEEKWKNGERVCIVGLGNAIQRVDPYYDENGKEVFAIDYGGTVVTNRFVDDFGEEYNVIGASEIGNFVFPVYSVNRDYQIDRLYISFKQPITFECYQELKRLLLDATGEKAILPDIDFSEGRNIYLYKTVLLICALLAFAAGLNFVILYHFVILSRQRKYAIYRVCGFTVTRCVSICFVECVLLTVPIYIIATILYHFILIPLLEDIYPYISEQGRLGMYLVLGLIYLGITMLLSIALIIIRINRMSIVLFQKGGC